MSADIEKLIRHNEVNLFFKERINMKFYFLGTNLYPRRIKEKWNMD